MFTGLVQTCGTLTHLQPHPQGGATLHIHTPHLSQKTAIGDSIAVNGVCLTATDNNNDTLTFHTLAHTLSTTNLDTLRTGDPVNLEPALRLGDPLGGHQVTGHIDCTCPITAWHPTTGDDWLLDITIPPDYSTLVIPRGSIALDGISLTIAEIRGHTLRHHIIPHTRLHTNLQHKKPGMTLNTEFDIIGKYITRHLAHTHPAIPTLANTPHNP